MKEFHIEVPQQLEVIQFFEGLRKYAATIPEKRYPHQNRFIALLHLLCDSVSKLTRKRMEVESQSAVCGNGCDACCYFAEITSSRTEFDEIRHYLHSNMAADACSKLDQQWFVQENEHSSAVQPCPFLLQDQGCCSIYPVRPLGCRLLLSSRKCSKEDESSGAFDSCQEWSRLGWKEMPLRPDTLMKALESQRSGKDFFEPGKLYDEEKVDLKAFTHQELRGMLKQVQSTQTAEAPMCLQKQVVPPSIP